MRSAWESRTATVGGAPTGFLGPIIPVAVGVAAVNGSAAVEGMLVEVEVAVEGVAVAVDAVDWDEDAAGSVAVDATGLSLFWGLKLNVTRDAGEGVCSVERSASLFG